MQLLLTVCIALVLLVGLSSQQHRVPPGVPPQQYAQQGQHQMPHMHQQQVPMHQQVPVQHQVPMHQQQQQHIPQQQVPIQAPQQHYQGVPVQQGVPVHQGVPVQHVAGGQQIFNAAHMAQEKDHIKEHLDVPIDTSNMSEQELQFHYFKMHDADNNNKLDGCELIKSLIHWHDSHKDDHETTTKTEKFTDEDIMAVLEPVFKVADKNNDGFLDYIEYIEHSGVRIDTTNTKN